MDSSKLTTMRHVTDDNKTEGVSLRDVQPAKTVGSDAPTRSQQIKCGNSLSIRQEIQRFESVHPSIYAVYDMLELISDPLICQQIREQIVCIEGQSSVPLFLPHVSAIPSYLLSVPIRILHLVLPSTKFSPSRDR